MVEVGTIASPTEDGRPIVGIQVEQSANIQLPVDVEIDLAGVGGPSAGLAFALDIVEELRGIRWSLRTLGPGTVEVRIAEGGSGGTIRVVAADGRETTAAL